jgi:hypothetical protein
MAQRLKSSERHLRAQQAKEFLISQVVEEAQREDKPLSEVERKMLFFTETEETLPDMATVSDKFEHEYDTPTYEKKISGLLRNAFKHGSKETPDFAQRWKQAVADLRKEDHYLLIMVDQATRSIRPPGDQLKLWSTGIAIVGVIAGALFLAGRYHVDLDRYIPSRDQFSFFIWATVAALALAYITLRLLLGKQRMDELFLKVIETVFASSSRGK